MTPEELRSLRERHGLSQAELAALVGVTTACISLWERGKSRISPIFIKWHAHMLLVHGDVRAAVGQPRLGRPPTAREREKAEAAERLERERSIVCSVRFCAPGSGRPMDPLTFRPYYGIDEPGDGRAKVVTRWVVFEHEHEIPWRRTPAIPMEGWSEAGWSVLREQLAAQLVAMGHPPEMAEMYRLGAGAHWSWHKVETSRPECIVTLAGTATAFGGLTVVS